MMYYFRDTHFKRLHKLGCFWAPARHRLRGEVFRGALQIYVVLPRFRWCWVDLRAPVFDILAGVPAIAWTGRDREFRWRVDPGYLQIELRTPCRWRWSWRTGRAL